MRPPRAALAPACPPHTHVTSSAIAYLCDQYPAVSHTFIQREVVALRGLGTTVETISIRRSTENHVLSRRDREEFGRTFAILPARAPAVIAAQMRALVRRPRSYVRAL